MHERGSLRSGTAPARPSRRKTAIFAGVLILVVVTMMELVAHVAGVVIVGRTFSLPRLQRQRDALVRSGGRVTSAASARWLEDEVLHPYVGFAPPGGEPPKGVGSALAAAPPTRGDDRVVVAFVGGSFAQIFYDEGAPHLLARLSELPAYRGKRLIPVSLGFAGYKEPQQFLSVAYLLSIGASFDVIVNIDGFNDIVIHPTENATAGVFPAYPRRWHRRVEGILPGGSLRLMLRRIQLEEQRAGVARVFSAFPWPHLRTANLVYAVMDGSLERRVAETDRALAGERGASAVATGPEKRFGSEAEATGYLVDLWQRGSRQLHALARANGARYYHFLQPNQYVPGAKPIAEAEARMMSNTAYRSLVTAGYPLLQQAGRALAADGVRFVDLSGVFRDRPEPLYVDGCCHVGARGNAIVADAIFEAIRRDQ